MPIIIKKKHACIVKVAVVTNKYLPKQWFFGVKGNWEMAAHAYFNAKLWLQHPFKNDVFFAYNGKHLHYLEQYIAAGLREHKNRTGFTLLEKLPKFYHEAKNRNALLKIIDKLKRK